MTFVYVCSENGCEDRQSKYCGSSYRCPFCGDGLMTVQEEIDHADCEGCGNPDCPCNYELEAVNE